MSIAQNFPIISPSLNLDFANVQALDPRITFARATTATYYGTRTALAEQNLVLYSQEFDNGAWLKDALTVTANTTTAPDGTTTADTLIENTATSNHGVRGTVVANVGFDYTISVFAKPNGRDFLHLSYNAAASNFYAQATFNVSTGAVTGSGAVGWTLVSTAISSAPNGFYRCSLTFTVVSQAGASNCLCVSDTGTPSVNTVGRSVYTGDGTSGLFLWGAQLEQRSTVTAYTVTTTQPITNYIPVLETAASGVARFDHNPTTFESLGLLVEQQSTNLLTYSEQFDNAAWTKLNSTVTANTFIAPDGTLTGDLLIPNVGSASGALRQALSQTGVITVSVYAKANGITGFRLGSLGNGGTQRFNLVTGQLGATTGIIISAEMIDVGNGVYRCVATWNQTVSNTLFIDNNGFEVGDGYSGIYIWGAQLEALAFPTSYIPTVASQVTRAADSASMTGTNFTSWYNAAEGTVYGDSSLVGRPNAGSGYFFRLQGAGNGFVAYQNASNTSSISIFDDTSSASSPAGASAVGASQKFATAFSSSGLAAVWAGGAVGTTSVYNNRFATATGVDLFQSNGSASWNGRIKKLAYYPLRLTNAQLQALTS